MAKLKILLATALALAAFIAAPTSAQADGYRFGPVGPVYAPPVFGYGAAAPFGYYDREYRRAAKRAERDHRRHVKREAKAYRKLRRAHERYAFEFGYPYGVEFGPAPYRLAGDEYRYLRRLERDD
jgi:hypothetical protein